MLRDGRAVSGYRNLLCAQAETAEAEGYYELEETAPPAIWCGDGIYYGLVHDDGREDCAEVGGVGNA